MKYMRPKKKGCKIRLNPVKVNGKVKRREITIPMYCVVEIDERNTGAIVKIKALTGTEMDYGGITAESGGYFVKREYVNEMLANKRKFKITDDFNFIKLT
jgi:hypothetical protein